MRWKLITFTLLLGMVLGIARGVGGMYATVLYWYKPTYECMCIGHFSPTQPFYNDCQCHE